jgi:hypothetical protein
VRLNLRDLFILGQQRNTKQQDRAPDHHPDSRGDLVLRHVSPKSPEYKFDAPLEEIANALPIHITALPCREQLWRRHECRIVVAAI